MVLSLSEGVKLLRNVQLPRHNRKYWIGSSNLPGERIKINIRSIKERSFGGTKFWALIVDNYRDYCWSYVLKKDLNLKGKAITLLADLRVAGLNVK
jgi:hypothetical protein